MVSEPGHEPGRSLAELFAAGAYIVGMAAFVLLWVLVALGILASLGA